MPKKKATKPIVRTGQKKPFKKCTQQQVEERIEFTAGQLVRQVPKWKLAKELKKRYNLEFRQVADYIARSKKFLQKQASLTPQDAKEIGVNVLLDVFREGKPNERVQAEKCFREIFGYSAPTKIVDSRHPAEAVTISNPSPVLPQVHLFLPEGRKVMFKDPKEIKP